MVRFRKIAALALAAGLGAAAGAPAGAQDLRIGLSAEPSSIDPHFHNLTPNNALTAHVFGRLIEQDENQLLQPGLAESWEATDPNTWVFKLRQGVKFSDGSDFTAKDVIYTICRVPRVENSPGSFVLYVRAITEASAPDPHTLVLKTAQPHPLLPAELSTIGILSGTANGAGEIEYDRKECRNAGTYPKTEAFNAGDAAIGTGPYKLAQFTRGDRIVLERNDSYWGEAPAFNRVTFRAIGSAGPRVAALLSGDVDVIENVPIQDQARIKENASFNVVQGLSNRVIYLHFNYVDDKPPGVEGAKDNPFRDKRVREAISKAIDREAIVARIMGGVAMPAGELLPPQMFGANKDAVAPKPDVEGARKLLAEAGYPKAFSLVLGTPNDRYINDAMIAQAVAQMLSRAGFKVQIDAMTASQFFARRSKRDYGFWLAGWGAGSGDMSSPLRALAATPDRDKGMGTANPGGFSNPEMDKLLEEGLATVDDAKRQDLFARASRVAMEDFGVIPLHFEMSTWATRKDLEYVARADQFTLATGVSPKK